MRRKDIWARLQSLTLRKADGLAEDLCLFLSPCSTLTHRWVATLQHFNRVVLSSLKVLGDAFNVIFPITEHLPPDQPSALFGAFYEEQIFGGHVR